MFPGSRLDSTSNDFFPSCFISNYNLGDCPACKKPIMKGHAITKTVEEKGMVLRHRTHQNSSFYTPSTGARTVHIDCQIKDDDDTFFWTLWSAHKQSIEEKGLIC